jgi:hypothetical protein
MRERRRAIARVTTRRIAPNRSACGEYVLPLRREIFCEHGSRHRQTKIAQHMRPDLAGAVQQHEAVGRGLSRNTHRKY